MSKMLEKNLKGLTYFVRLVRAMILIRDLRIAKHLVKTGLTCKKVVEENGETYLWFPELKFSIHPRRHLFVLKTIRNIYQLNRLTSCNIKREADSILINVQDCRFYVNTVEDIYFLCDTFGQNTYNVVFPKKSVVMDIGMNIADTSIYFANKKNVVLVRAFEPFTPTFNMAVRNIKLNPGVASKIEPLNYGLSDTHRRLKCEYSPTCKGSVGIGGFVKSARKHVKDACTEEIEIKPVAEEVLKAKKDFPGYALVLKVDCEGAEFEIIASLARENLLSMISVILLEWHDKSPLEILQTLRNANFTVLLKDDVNQNIGMLYAFQQGT